MHMNLSLMLLAGISVLLMMMTVVIFIMYKEIKMVAKKSEKYIQYILEDTEETSVPINIEERDLKVMQERQKEKLLQEVLEGYFS